MVTVTWAQLKSVAESKNLSIQYVDQGDAYDLRIFDGESELLCTMTKDSGSDQTDFETNFKPSGNKTIDKTNSLQTFTHTFSGVPGENFDIDVTGFAALAVQTNSFATTLFTQGSTDGVLFDDLATIQVVGNTITGGGIDNNGLFMINVMGLKTFRITDEIGSTASVVINAAPVTPLTLITNPVVVNIRDLAGFDITSTNTGSNQGLDVNIVGGSISIPAGGATEAKQDVGNISLASIDSKLTNPLPISAASLPTHGVTQSGTWTVQPGNTANTTAWKVDGSAVTQPVSGTVTANAGTNLNTSTLALESGGNLAAIKADLDKLTVASGSGLTSQSGTIALANATTNTISYADSTAHPLSMDTSGLLRVSVKDTPANTNAFKVDGSGVTQPVSGTVTANATLAAETTKVIGTVNISSGQSVQIASGSAVIGHVINDASSAVIGHVITDTGSTTAVTGTVAVSVAAGFSNIAKAEDAASADSDVGVPAMAVRKASPANTSGTDGDYEMLQMSAGRLWTSSVIDTALPVGANIIGKVSVNQTSPGDTNAVSISHIAANAISSGNGTSSNGTFRVAIASDQTTNTNPFNVQGPTLTKGTQGSTGFSVQDLKDAGRNQTNFFMAIQIVSTSTDTLMSLTGYKSGAAVGATTTPAVVTSGKTFRITHISMNYTTIVTTPGSVRFTIRANTGGVVAITSPAVCVFEVGEPTGVAPVAGKKNTVAHAFPEGLEFAAGTGIGVSMVGLNTVGAAAAVGYGHITIMGYEY